MKLHQHASYGVLEYARLGLADLLETVRECVPTFIILIAAAVAFLVPAWSMALVDLCFVVLLASVLELFFMPLSTPRSLAAAQFGIAIAALVLVGLGLGVGARFIAGWF